MQSISPVDHRLPRARPLGPHDTDRLLTMPSDPMPGCAIPAVIVLGVIVVLLIMLQGPALVNAFRTAFGLFAPNPPANTSGGGGGGQSPVPSSGLAVVYRGSDSTGDLPLISMRDFTGGDAPITTSGTFTLSETMPMHPPATFADGTETTLIYGDLLADYVSLGFSNLDGSEGLGLNVQSGAWLATYLGQGCSWEVEVSPVSVSGHISCADIPAVNQDDGTTGSIDIELDFSADSAAPDG
jgi:hypothetical protein